MADVAGLNGLNSTTRVRLLSFDKKSRYDSLGKLSFGSFSAVIADPFESNSNEFRLI